MAARSNKKAEAQEPVQPQPMFGKEQILASAKYRSRRDLINALLDGRGTYTLAEVDRMIESFMKGKVK